MIARQNRFHGQHSVSRVKGSLLHSSNFSLRFAKNNKDDYRLAVVVSKKVDSRATVRNRIRRRIYETFRKQAVFEGKPIDLVVYVKNAEVAKTPYEELDQEIAKLSAKVLQQKK